MDKISPKEINTLLDAMSTGEIKKNELQKSIQPADCELYDFRRPDKFTKEQIRALEVLQSAFARLLSSFLSGYLRCNIQIEVASIVQLTYEDFMHSVPNPAVLTVFSLNPLKGTAIAQLDPEFLFPVIDLFFGGSGGTPKSIRDLTDIELSVTRKLMTKILDNLALAWKDIIQSEPVIDSVETNPDLLQVFSFNETVALISLTAEVGESAKGFINLCLPYTMLDPVVSQLFNQRQCRPSQTSEINEAEKKKLQQWLEMPPVELTVLAGQTWMLVNDFLQLQEGDVLLLDRRVDQDMDLYVEEQMKCKVKAGYIGSRLAVQITALAEGEKDG
jgi:flagellar motor switch protein FliM